MVFDLRRIDVKLNAVLDPLASSAEEGHWSAGGVIFKRHRLQGQIDGSIKIQAEGEKFVNKTKQAAEDDEEELGVTKILARNLAEEFEAVAVESGLGESRGRPIWNDGSKVKGNLEVKDPKIAEEGGSSWTECLSFVVTPSPPHAPIITKRMRFMDDEDRYEDLGVGRRLSRVLEAEFELAVESGSGKNSLSPLMTKKLKNVCVKSRRIGACGSTTWEKRGSIRLFR